MPAERAVTADDVARRSRLRIDVWGDVVCPMCYIGDARLEKAIERSGRADHVDLVFHPFELDPGASRDVTPNVDYVAAKFGVGAAQAAAFEAGLGELAAAEGLRFEIDRPKSSTHDILRSIQYANTQGVGWQYMRAVQRNIFAGHGDAFDHGVLAETGAAVGLDAAAVRAVLLDPRQYSSEVAQDRRVALDLGARGVPFTVFGDVVAIPGAASAAGYADAIERAWAQVVVEPR